MKQKNPKSINIQLSKCKNVKLEKFSNETAGSDTLNSDAELLKSYVNRIQEGMLSIIFLPPQTYNGRLATEAARKHFHGSVVKDTVWVFVPDRDILPKIMELKLLASYIMEWNNTRAFFKKNPIDIYKFLHQLYPICKCSNDFMEKHHSKYCHLDLKTEGWGCKFINSVHRHLNDGKGKRKYWYNYGYFDKNNDWIVDKALLRLELTNEVISKGIHSCPYFSMKEVNEKIEQLPNRIEPDNTNYEIAYKKDFCGDKIIDIPVNIQHICPTYLNAKYEQKRLRRIKELEYQIGMNKLQGKDLEKAKESLLVLTGNVKSYSQLFKMKLDKDTGYRFSDN